jgi:hypothetical protein
MPLKSKVNRLPFLIFLATVLFLTFLHRWHPCVAGTFSSSFHLAGVPPAAVYFRDVCIASCAAIDPAVTDRLVAACFMYKFFAVARLASLLLLLLLFLVPLVLVFFPADAGFPAVAGVVALCLTSSLLLTSPAGLK